MGFAQTFTDVLLKKTGELEYLRLLLESQFPQQLADYFAKQQGGMPSKVTVEISYIDKSPRILPVANGWAWDGVEFGDLLLAVDWEFISRSSGGIKSNPKWNRAFVFQSKLTENEGGESTRKQEFLYRNWPTFTVVDPHEIRSERFTELKFARVVKQLEKSGAWIIHNPRENDPSPFIILRDTSVDVSRSFADFVDAFSKRQVGREYKIDDDWSEFIGKILGYTKRMKLRRKVADSDTFRNTVATRMRMPGELSFLETFDLPEEEFPVASLSICDIVWKFLRTKIFRCELQRRLWIVQINITELELPQL